MTKGQLIEDIRQLNPTAQPAFLEEFDEDSLHEYRQRLLAMKEQTIRIGGWTHKKRLRAAS